MIRLPVFAGFVATLLTMCWLNLRWLEQPLDLSAILSDKPATVAGLDGAGPVPDGALPDLRGGTTEALLRPLFHADRRPFAPPPVETAAPVAEAEMLPEPVAEPQPVAAPLERPQVRLAGVSLSGATRRALLGAADGAEMRWYLQGETVGGWVVAAIGREAVTLASGEQSVMLPLYPSSAPGQ